jgi:hypothetical protein
MKRWKFWQHDRCPHCDRREDVPHVTRCTHGAANETWAIAMNTFSTWLAAQNTFPSLTQLFVDRLTAWRNNRKIHFPEPQAAYLATAYHEQSDIGWYNFLQGRISNHWVAIQSAYYKHLGSLQTGHTWARKLIHQLWDISWNMWQNRNHILHNVHTESDTRLSNKLDTYIRKEFDIDIDGLAPTHHYMVRRTRLHRLLLWGNQEKSAWLNTIKLARMAWKRHIKLSRRQRQILKDSVQPP